MPLPEQAVQPLTSLVVGLINLKSAPSPVYGSRYHSDLFRELPARDLYPDYYVLIKEPRSLNGVMDSMKKGIYSSPAAVAYDLFLIWSNAREYNQQGSLVYADAEVLEDYMKELWYMRTPPLPPWSSLMRPEDLNSRARPPPPPHAVATPAPAEPKIKKIKLMSSYSSSSAPTPPQPPRQPVPQPPRQPHASTSYGTPAPARATPHLRLAGPAPAPPPAPATPSNPPLTLKLALKPLAPPIPSPSYASHSPAGTPAAAPTFSGYSETPKEKKRHRETTPGGTEKPKGEGKKERKAREKAERKAKEKAEREKMGGGDASFVPLVASVPDIESGWLSGGIGPNPIGVYLDIIRQLREFTDAQGRPIATPFLTVPDAHSRPDYFELVKDPIAFDTIENKARNGLYSSPEAFDRDLHTVFEIGKLFVQPDSPGNGYTDLIVLQRLYHELTKRRSAFSLPPPPPSTGEAPNSSSVGLTSDRPIKKEDGTAVEGTGVASGSSPVVKDKIHLDSINFKGEVFRVGDWIHLFNPNAPRRPIVGIVWQTYKRVDSLQRCFSVCWFHRPEETVHPGTRQFYENEVFKTGDYDDYTVEDFVSRCMVMPLSRYVRGRPKPPTWTPGMALYVCESRYKDNGQEQSFKKIKNWPLCLPEEVRRRMGPGQEEYELELFAAAAAEPKLVPSPFVVNGGGGSGAQQQQQGKDAGQQAEYLFLSGGTPVAPATLALQKAEQQQRRRAGLAAVAPGTGGGIGIGITSSSFASAGATASAPATATATPAEIAVLTESFSALPVGLKSKFRCADSLSDSLAGGDDVLWFTAPAAAVPTVVSNSTRPTHSLEYLYWRAMRLKQGGFESATLGTTGRNGAPPPLREDVEMMLDA